MQGVILNQSIFNGFYCAILSVEQDQGLANAYCDFGLVIVFFELFAILITLQI